MQDEEIKDLMPKKQSLFPVTPEDIVDNALQNLDENQARKINERAADEVMRLAVEKRKAEYRNATAHEEMNTVINNATLLDRSVDNFKINSTFETASGTTNVEIEKKQNNLPLFAALGIAAAALIALVIFLLAR